MTGRRWQRCDRRLFIFIKHPATSGKTSGLLRKTRFNYFNYFVMAGAHHPSTGDVQPAVENLSRLDDDDATDGFTVVLIPRSQARTTGA